MTNATDSLREYCLRDSYAGSLRLWLFTLLVVYGFARLSVLPVAASEKADEKEVKPAWSISSKNLSQTEPSQTEPSQTESSQTESSQTESSQTESSQTESSQTEPSQLASTDGEQVDTESNKQVDLEPQASEPAREQEPVVSTSQTPNLPKQRVATQPILDLDPQLRDNLERQFALIRELQETEDAFNAQLGEAYLGYGQALLSAGRLEEARKMFANALHISKINNGVYSMEQRPVLRAMFEMSYALGNLEDSEDNLRRIIWLEKNHSGERDNYSFDMVLKLGNQYIDQYLQRPTASEASLALLDSAERYLKYAVDRYGDQPLDELFMPYGELALVYFLKSKIQVEVRRPVIDERREQSILQRDRTLEKAHSRETSFEQAERYLRTYFRKAKNAGRVEDTVKALTDIADLNLLYGRRSNAAHFYEMAWLEAQKLPADHSLIVEFDQPVALPAFNYAQQRGHVEGRKETLYVPLTFNLDDHGRVRRFSSENTGGPHPELLTRAKRVAKRMLFRPVIENGKMIGANDFTYDIKVKVRKNKTRQS